MILNIVLVVVILIAFGIIAFILFRKFPKLKTLDVSTVPAARRAEVRDRILMERMKRSSEKGRKIIKKSATPVFKIFGVVAKKVFKKVYDLENKYKKEAENKIPLKAGDLNNKIKNLFVEASTAAKDEKFQEAEKIYIEIIGLDPRSLDAYKGLTDVYIEMKEYQQAVQTAEFVLKLEGKKSKEIEKESETGQKYNTVNNSQELADIYSDIGFIYQLSEKIDLSAVNYFKAFELEPRNPRNISQMLEIYIKQKKKAQAIGLLDRLEKVNPENQKLKEYSEQISKI
jgi:tetratricopeptide (TPR) repeat protein